MSGAATCLAERRREVSRSCLRQATNATVKNYIRTLGLPATNIYTSYYFSNILSAPVTRKGDALVLENAMPDNTRIASFAVEQMGLWALAAFKDPGKWIGTYVWRSGFLV
jgi:hypothetical protein